MKSIYLSKPIKNFLDSQNLTIGQAENSDFITKILDGFFENFPKSHVHSNFYSQLMQEYVLYRKNKKKKFMDKAAANILNGLLASGSVSHAVAVRLSYTLAKDLWKEREY